AAAARDAGQTMYDWLLQVYKDHGYYKEGLINVVRKGAEGEREIRAMMERFRMNSPQEIGGSAVVRILDYKVGIEQNVEEEVTRPLDFPKSDVLQFYTADGSKISVRPSGTEPKIKFYISVSSNLPSLEAFGEVSKSLDDRIAAISASLGN
ncbi:MAG: phospho-sugar mutase, partial [Bacteroidota bacterium]